MPDNLNISLPANKSAIAATLPAGFGSGLFEFMDRPGEVNN